MSLIDDPKTAERLAMAILDDITLYNDERVRLARDVEAELAPELEEGRSLFERRVVPELHHIFKDEVMPWTTRSKMRAGRLGSAPMDRTRLLLVVGALVAFVGVVVWIATHS